MDPTEVMVDLVLQVSKYLLILLLIGCTTNKNASIYENRQIFLSDKTSNTPKTFVLDKKEFEKVNDLDENPVIGSISTMTMDGSDLWIGKIGGALLRYNIYTNDSLQLFDDEYSIIDHSIKKIIVSGKWVYILKSNSLSIFNKSNNETQTFLLGQDIHRASDMIMLNNQLYVSTLGFGLFSYNIQTEEISNITSQVEYLSSISTDGSKLFIGSMNNGLYLYDVKNNKYLSRLNIPLQFFNKNITKMNFNNDVLYVGTAKNGLIKWYLTSNKIDRLYKDQSVSSIFIDGDKTAISFIGFGVYIESCDNKRLESIRTFLKTNNITTVALLDNSIITGNLKKGIIKQEMKLLND